MTPSGRAEESNLLLLCSECHRTIDSVAYRDKFTVEFLTEKKAQHERRVREVTEFPTLRPATVIRLTGTVRGTVGPATDGQISEALRAAGLTGMGAATRTGAFDIDLQHDEGDPWIWAASKQKIDAIVARTHEAVAAQDTGILAVFAIAPIPTLAYLGAALDDKTEIHLFQRRRDDVPDVWSWKQEAASGTAFDVAVSDGADEQANNVVALVEVTAPIEPSRVPAELAELPVARLRASHGLGPDAIKSPTDLAAFGMAWRDLLTEVERRWPLARRLHVLSAVPTTVAVSIGRHRMRTVHPAFVIYQREGETYVPGMEIS